MADNNSKKRKIRCPYCGAVDSRALLGPKAQAADVWMKCKVCKKEFELKVP